MSCQPWSGSAWVTISQATTPKEYTSACTEILPLREVSRKELRTSGADQVRVPSCTSPVPQVQGLGFRDLGLG